MRLVVLDTETTGLRVEEGHRLIEIGCVECLDRRVTERQFHCYLNPEREVDEGATQVHGMTWDQLKDKPVFADIAQEFIEFVRGAQVVIHNAVFDCGFLDSELKRLGMAPLAEHVDQVIDSLVKARELHPGQRNSLDALCQRYTINNEHRSVHGALLDARLLADVYLAMTRGQESLEMSSAQTLDNEGVSLAGINLSGLVIRRANSQEVARHREILAQINTSA
jgi:DNA polymerase III subunit epsilon